MTISCPRCGLAFETQATTSARSRRCKAVVRVGSGPARPKVRTPAAGEPDDAPAGGVPAAVAVVVLVLAIAVPSVVQAIRRHRDGRVPTLADSDPAAADPATGAPGH